MSHARSIFDATQPSYLRFRDIFAERTRGVVVWCGAGCSATAGMPTWTQLRKALEAELESTIGSLDADDAEPVRRQLEGIRKIPDAWNAFGQLKNALGQASYESAIRAHLTPSSTVDSPRVYSDLWGLDIRGFLTLNLDRLACRGFRSRPASSALTELPGRDVGRLLHILKGQAPFIVNLHGMSEDSTTWVLTAAELTRLQADPGYQAFITTIFASFTVLFIGISADDDAAGGLLGNLRRNGIDPGDHFWITDRRDAVTHRWAQDNGIQPIRYDSAAGHESVFRAIVEDLQRYVPADSPAPPVVGAASGTSTSLPPPDELAQEAPETIRRRLSAHASHLLQTAGADAYEEMRRQYARAIHNAYYFSPNPPDNVLFGLTIEGTLGTGAFGNVYRGRNQNGEPVAIKVLRHEVMAKAEMLATFRRGVRSMRILANHRVAGMVPYHEAYEMPPCVMMDLVEGPNLQQAVESGRLDPWTDGLKVLVEAGAIIRRAHMLPERVLHRDIRPPNIMLSGFNDSTTDWEVVVLDFDMSWHRGSTEKSIVDISAGTALGYMAPEQLVPNRRFSTRSTAVDAFGLGATIYFVFSKQHPAAGKPQSRGWSSDVRAVFSRFPCRTWRSGGERLARLVIRCTNVDQDSRPDMGRLQDELSRLREATLDPDSVRSAELWAEELIAHAVGDEYEWNPDTLEATHQTPTGWSTTTKGDEASGEVILSSSWLHKGQQNRREVAHYVKTAVEKATALLKKSGWQIRSSNYESQSLLIVATLPVEGLSAICEKASKGLAQHIQTVA
jgi:eukaryotic-like serine/threonine-protein kinase